MAQIIPIKRLSDAPGPETVNLIWRGGGTFRFTRGQVHKLRFPDSPRLRELWLRDLAGNSLVPDGKVEIFQEPVPDSKAPPAPATFSEMTVRKMLAEVLGMPMDSPEVSAALVKLSTQAPQPPAPVAQGDQEATGPAAGEGGSVEPAGAPQGQPGAETGPPEEAPKPKPTKKKPADDQEVTRGE